MTGGEDPDTETLRLRQAQVARAERERERDAATPAEARTAARRADKAAYLRDKLDEQAEHPGDLA